MIKQKKKEYDAPMVELIDARIEKGFQPSSLSSNGTLSDNISEGDSYDNRIFS